MSSSTVISHSEVDTFLMCEQRHYYAFGDNEGKGLEPKTHGTSLSRGIVGHKALEMAFKALMEGSSIADASDIAIATVNDYAKEPNPNFEILTQLTQSILPRYFAEKLPEWINHGWKIVAVEKTFRLEVTTAFGTLVYPFTPDAILLSPTREFNVVDHKFVYNFYTNDMIDILPQIPKYTGALRALGKPIYGGIYNMLRWRPVKDMNLDAHYRTKEFQPSPARVKHSFQTQVDTMLKIRELKEGDPVEWKNKVNLRRVQNNMICNHCPFKTLCTMEMNGSNVEILKRVDFQTNTYGYTEVEDE